MWRTSGVRPGRNHFAWHLAKARERGEDGLAPAPDAATIEAIIDATFWASLRREEGRSPKISLAFFQPNQVPQPLIFERALPLTPDVLTKLGPAVERPGVHLGVWRAVTGRVRLTLIMVSCMCGVPLAKCPASASCWK
jgi:hypothetical protein